MFELQSPQRRRAFTAQKNIIVNLLPLFALGPFSRSDNVLTAGRAGGGVPPIPCSQTRSAPTVHNLQQTGGGGVAVIMRSVNHNEDVSFSLRRRCRPLKFDTMLRHDVLQNNECHTITGDN
ncbi:hypothetical protein Q8A73_021719 [Channa argus]|nr:hypothetical protein Q8A73_021719 [Channa argus]